MGAIYRGFRHAKRVSTEFPRLVFDNYGIFRKKTRKLINMVRFEPSDFCTFRIRKIPAHRILVRKFCVPNLHIQL